MKKKPILKQEKDLRKILDQLEELRAKAEKLKSQWLKEKEVIQKIRKLKEKIDQLKIEAQQAERKGDLNRVAEIIYGIIPQLEKELEEENKKLAKIQKEGKFLKEEVDAEDIAEIISKWTGIPVSRLLESEREKLLKIEERLKQRVVGQDHAISAVANALRRARAGLKDPNRPIGSFMFIGPTGVGKTELAKALAEFMFDTENALIRIDMSEYMEKHSVARLIGAPPGYVGYEEGGQLTEAVRRKPYSVILFDEIEKAHPDVFNILLQILEEGELTDHLGHTVNFRETIIIITSNIGANKLQKAIKMGFYQQSENDKSISMELISDELKETFRPEFLNRIDEIVVFNFLTKEHLSKILDIMLDELNKDISELYNITISISKSAKNYLVEKAYDKKYGARPLRRIIQKEIEDNLSTAILKGKLSDNQIAYIDYDEKKGITIKAKKRSKKRKKETSKTFQ